MRLQAVNNVIIVAKDTSYFKLSGEKLDTSNMNAIPEPYTGTIDSVGADFDDYKIGDRVAFIDMGGAYIELDGEEYVVITPDMVIGKL